MSSEELETHRAKMRLYNRTRYAQMTEEQRQKYLSLNVERNRLRRVREDAARKEYEKTTTKEMTEEAQKMLMEYYEKNPRPTREALDVLAVETGIFWKSIRVRRCQEMPASVVAL